MNDLHQKQQQSFQRKWPFPPNFFYFFPIVDPLLLLVFAIIKQKATTGHKCLLCHQHIRIFDVDICSQKTQLIQLQASFLFSNQKLSTF